MKTPEFDALSPSLLLEGIVDSAHTVYHDGSAAVLIDVPRTSDLWPDSVWAVMPDWQNSYRLERIDVLGRFLISNETGSDIRSQWLEVTGEQALGGQELVAAPDTWHAVGSAALIGCLSLAKPIAISEAVQVMRVVGQNYQRVPVIRRNAALDALHEQGSRLNTETAGHRQGLLRWLRNRY